MSEPELSEFEEAILRRSYRTVIDMILEREPNPCIALKNDAPVNMGVLSISVCGLPKGHSGLHRAGWTGYGETWSDEATETYVGRNSQEER